MALAEAASAISAELHFEPALALHTIFPERSRWRLASPLSETELPELGELALIVQFQRIEVRPHRKRNVSCGTSPCGNRVVTTLLGADIKATYAVQ